MSNIFDLFKKIEAPAPSPVTFVVAGLGNPGKEYENTRHNAGYLTLDAIAATLGVKIDRARFQGLSADCNIGGVRVLLLKPETFMNLSGRAVGDALHFYKLPPENLIVLCDDISFEPGRIRIRRKGSHGGHNGLRNITDVLGTDSFTRIKIGVGQKPNPEYDLADWVLGKLPEADKKALLARAPDIKEALSLIVNGETDAAMNRFSK